MQQSESFGAYNPGLSLVSQHSISSNVSTNPTSIPQQSAFFPTNLGLTSVSVMDDLVKEYLLFRGFNSCIKSLELDLKQDKDKSMKADKVIEQLFAFIYSFDLNGLMDYWLYLDTKYFSRLTLKFMQHNSNSSSSSLTRKYELFLLRYYLIHAVQSSKTDKAIEFFENYAYKLQSQNEWKEWYCLPFLKNPEDNPTFSVYFSKNWIDTFVTSLQNFLNIIFQSIQYPRLMNCDEETLLNFGKTVPPKTPNQFKASSVFTFEQDFLHNELNDEFQLLQNDQKLKPANNSLISMLKNFTYSSKPKPTEAVSTESLNLPQPAASKHMPLLTRKLTIDSTLSKSSRKSSYSSHRSNSTLVSGSAKQVDTIAEDENFKKSPQTCVISQNESQNVGNTRRKSTTKSLSMSDSAASSQADFSEPPRSNPYLTLSQEEYTQHKSHILHCKFSKDGKYIASVDAQGVIKIWSIDNTTLNTLMQKSVIISIEWDKRSNKVLYLGTQTSVVKLYDIIQKRIVQEINLNKIYPVVTNIITSELCNRLLIMTTSKPSKPGDMLRNSQMVVCNTSGANGSVVVEKFIELEMFFCQCSIIHSENIFILGCSDGQIRVFSLESMKFTQSYKGHDSCVLNMVANRDNTKFFTIASDQRIKIWKFNSLETQKLDLINSIVVQFETSQSVDVTTAVSSTFTSSFLSVIRNQNDNELKTFSSGTVMAFDNSEKFFFLVGKHGVYLHEILSSDEANGQVDCERLVDSDYALENATTVEIWNASTSCILLVGSATGCIRIFKLLQQN